MKISELMKRLPIEEGKPLTEAQFDEFMEFVSPLNRGRGGKKFVRVPDDWESRPEVIWLLAKILGLDEEV